MPAVTIFTQTAPAGAFAFNNGTARGPSGHPAKRCLPMDALTLKKLYESQLQEDLQPPVAPDVDPRETRYMLRVSRGMAPGTLCEDDQALLLPVGLAILRVSVG